MVNFGVIRLLLPAVLRVHFSSGKCGSPSTFHLFTVHQIKNMNHYLGIDIGTSSVKVLAVTPTGKTLGRYSADIETHSPHRGYQEQRPEDILRAVITALAAAVKNTKGEVLGAGFSSAMHGLICVDENDKPLTNCWLWSDARSAEVAQSLKKNALGDKIFAETGTPIHPMSPLCKIRWLQENEPNIFAQTATFFDLKSYVIFRLFGEKVIDYSMASATGLFANEKMRWSQLALDFCGISEEKLVKFVPTSHRLPDLSEEYVKKTGLSPQTPFIIGAGDGVLANLGAGATAKDEVALTIGTSAAVRTADDVYSVAENGSLFTYILEENTFLIGGASNNGGNVLEWFSKKFTDRIKGKSEGELVKNMLESSKEIPAGAEGLLFLPYIFGERAPLWNAEAKGGFYHVTHRHGQAHFAKAVLEGILLNLRLILTEIEKVTGRNIERVIAGGGFFRSESSAQLAADIFGKTVILRENVDNSAYGAVLMTMKALGAIENYAEREDWLTEGGRFVPDAERVGVYEEVSREFREIVSGM